MFLEKTIQSAQLTKAKVAGSAGISRQALDKILTGQTTTMRLETLVNLAQAIGVHPLVLMRKYFQDHPLYERKTTVREPGDASGFVRDVTIPDNSIVYVGSRFTKTWEIQNIGKQIWCNRALVCMDRQIELKTTDDAGFRVHAQRQLVPSQTRIPIPELAPGEKVCLSVDFICPGYPATIVSVWKMVNEHGELCFPEYEGLSCMVQVFAV